MAASQLGDTALPGFLARFDSDGNITDLVTIEDMNGMVIDLDDPLVSYFWQDAVTGAYIDYNYAAP